MMSAEQRGYKTDTNPRQARSPSNRRQSQDLTFVSGNQAKRQADLRSNTRKQLNSRKVHGGKTRKIFIRRWSNFRSDFFIITVQIFLETRFYRSE